jgi:multiple sugar transport system substrate-binding protein
MNETSGSMTMNRRSFLAASAAAFAASAAGKGFAADSTLTFWDMVWGTGAGYTAAAK